MSAKKLVVNVKKDMGEWTTKMKSIYTNKLAITHIIRVHDKEYPVNSAVLHAALPNIPASQWQQYFSQVSNDIIGDILQYLYSCEIKVSMVTLKKTLQASKILKLTHLHDACIQLLMENLGPENCIGWYKFCIQENLEFIAEYCREQIARDLNKVRQCDEFQGLTFAELNDLIKNHEQNVDTQFHAIMTWVLGHEERCGQVEDLIELIDLSKCSRECLQTASETPYKEVLWSASLQHKLLRASLKNSSTKDPQGDQIYQPSVDETRTTKEHVIGLQMQPNIDFAKSIMSTCQSFKTASANTDIIIQLSTGEIKAHQIVLTTASKYFEALIRTSNVVNKTEACGKPVITDLTQLYSAAVEALVDYMYTGKIVIDNHALLDHIHACDFLHLETLMNKCKTYAEKGINIKADNCFQWMVGSNLFDLPKTKVRAVNFVCKNFSRVYQSEGLLSLGNKELFELLQNDALGCLPEETLYTVLIQWMKHHQEDRKGYLSDFLKSRAMKCCSINQNLDIKDALEGGNFDVDERDQIWTARFARQAVVRICNCV